MYNAEYRTSVLTLACCVVGTLLEIHYNSAASGSGGSTSTSGNGNGNGRAVRGACAAG